MHSLYSHFIQTLKTQETKSSPFLVKCIIANKLQKKKETRPKEKNIQKMKMIEKNRCTNDMCQV